MSGDLDDIREAMRGPYICDEELRRIEYQPCERMGVALRQWPDGDVSPVCAHHVGPDMVPLDVIAAALRGFGQVVTHET